MKLYVILTSKTPPTESSGWWDVPEPYDCPNTGESKHPMTKEMNKTINTWLNTINEKEKTL